MKRRPFRILLMIAAMLCIAALLRFLPAALRPGSAVPGLDGPDRTLLRIWITGSPGGAPAWLTSQLRIWEKQHPGTMTYLRTVRPDEALAPDAVLPDVILYMPGDFASPDTLFTPLTDFSVVREPLRRAGRFRDTQFGLPLCWGAWVLAIDGALEPEAVAPPAPTTLLGRPTATDAPLSTPGYPLQAVSDAPCPLQSPGGAALFTLQCILPAKERPPLPEDFAQHAPATVYAAFQSRQCATAMLTTGQATAFTSLTAAGRGFPFRIMAAEEVVTDQVWMASITPDAPSQAGELLAFLTSREAQQALVSQGLHTIRDDLTLYAAGFSHDVEAAGRTALSAVNAYLPSEQIHSAAWQAFQGSIGFSEALLPLL